MRIVDDGLRAKFFHPVGGNSIDALCQSTSDGHHISGRVSHGVAGCPGGWILPREGKGDGSIGNFIARGIAIIYDSRINKGLDSRTRLPFSLHHVVKLKILVINSANPCFYVT